MDLPKPIKHIWVDELQVKIYHSRREMGVAAAIDTMMELHTLSIGKDVIRMIFAAAPSQNEFLDHLTQYNDQLWKKVEAFHMDEYVGLESIHPQRFGNFLRKRLFEKLPFNYVHYLNPENEPIDTVIRNYEKELNLKPIDIVVLGIGENTHIAFNDPPVADFKDPHMVKIVSLDVACKQQQVNDGCFANISDVPPTALTLTVPALFAGRKLVCIVPGERKSQAVYHTLTEKISEKYPASILREHPNATLYLDKDAAKRIM